MGAILTGKVLSAKISDMAGIRFGRIILETNSGQRYDMKYDSESKGDIPEIGSLVSVNYEDAPFLRIIWIKPESTHAWITRAEELELEDKFDEAFSSYNAALQMEPNYAIAWYNKAMLHFRLQQMDELKECYAKLLELQPHSDMTSELEMIIQADAAEREDHRVARETQKWVELKGFSVRYLNKEKRDLITSNLESVTRHIFRSTDEIHSDLVVIREPPDSIQYSEKLLLKPESRLERISSGHPLFPIYKEIMIDRKKGEYAGSIWVHHRLGNRNNRSPNEQNDSMSILYQGVLVEPNTVLFPNVIISTILDYSIPQGITFFTSPTSLETKEVLYYRNIISGNEPEEIKPLNLNNLKDSHLPTLFFDPISGYDAGIIALKAARETESDIMDTFTRIPSGSIYETRKDTKSKKYAMIGTPIISIIPRQSKTIISVQVCPNTENQEDHAIIQEVGKGNEKALFEIGMPSIAILSPASKLVDMFRKNDYLPKEDNEKTGFFVLWSHVIIGLDIARQIYFPMEDPLRMREILTKGSRYSKIENKLNQEYSDIQFSLNDFRPARGRYS